MTAVREQMMIKACNIITIFPFLVYNKFPQTDRVKKLFSLKGDHNAR